jgi:hypothetical protein
VVHEVLRIQSLTQTEKGLLVRRSTNAGYQDGDCLVAIDGKAVRSFRDLQDVLARSQPGTIASLHLLRETPSSTYLSSSAAARIRPSSTRSTSVPRREGEADAARRDPPRLSDEVSCRIPNA